MRSRKRCGGVRQHRPGNVLPISESCGREDRAALVDWSATPVASMRRVAGQTGWAREDAHASGKPSSVARRAWLRPASSGNKAKLPAGGKGGLLPDSAQRSLLREIDHCQSPPTLGAARRALQHQREMNDARQRVRRRRKATSAPDPWISKVSPEGTHDPGRPRRSENPARRLSRASQKLQVAEA